MATIDDVTATYFAITRSEINPTVAQATADAIDGGTYSLSQYEESLINGSVTTTQAALALSAFITGAVPSEEQFNNLTAFATTQFNYYTNTLQSSNAQLGAYEALGAAYATDATTSADFAARYGLLSPTDFVNSVYSAIFGAVPSAGAAANLVSQVNYFIGIYTAAGISADVAALQAKGAVLGQIMGYAFTSTDPTLPVSPLPGSVEGALGQIAQEARDGVDSTVFGEPIGGFGGNAIDVGLVAAPVVVALDEATNASNTATVYGDTVTGTIRNGSDINTAAGNDSIGTAAATVGIEATIDETVIDGSAGEDVLYATLLGNLDDNLTVKGVEKIYIQGAGGFATVDTENFSGVNELWGFKTAAGQAVVFQNVADGIVLGAQGTAGDTTFELAEDVTTVDLSVKSTTDGEIELIGDDLETVNVNVLANSVTDLTVAATVETVTITGSAQLATVLTGTGIQTVDAAGLEASISLEFEPAVDFADGEVSITTTGKNDIVDLDLSNDTVTKLATGAGSDQIRIDFATLNNLTFDADGELQSYAEITDFKVGSDTLQLQADATNFDAFEGDLIGVATLEDAVGIVAGLVDDGDYTYFEYNDEAYVYFDGLDAGLIKISGVTGLTFDGGTFA